MPHFSASLEPFIGRKLVCFLMAVPCVVSQARNESEATASRLADASALRDALAAELAETNASLQVIGRKQLKVG